MHYGGWRGCNKILLKANQREIFNCGQGTHWQGSFDEIIRSGEFDGFSRREKIWVHNRGVGRVQTLKGEGICK